MAGCTENRKRLFGIPYDGPHDWLLARLEPWGASHWRNHAATFVCGHCGAERYEFGLEDDVAIRLEKRAPKSPDFTPKDKTDE